MCICSLLCSHVENASVAGETCKSVESDLLDLDSIKILLATGPPENGASPKCFLHEQIHESGQLGFLLTLFSSTTPTTGCL